MKCDRCGKEKCAITVSYLSTESVCSECKEAEKNHPLYEFGKRIEFEEVKKGNMNFEGILHGLEGNPKEVNLMAQIKFNDDPEKIGEAFSNMVNNFSFDSMALATLFTINGIDFVKEAMSWVYYMANTRKVDARNLASNKRCAEINFPKQPLLPVAEFMAKDHPTLQQTYTSFVLAYLFETPHNLPMV